MYRSGNVLFLILLAVALFAALSYAVTQSSRSGGKDISEEDARLAASQIIQYATLIEQTVTRLRLSNGCRDTQISFAADSDGDGNWFDADDDYHNPNAPSDFSCHVFHTNGGAVPRIQPSESKLDTAQSTGEGFGDVFFGPMRVRYIGTFEANGYCGSADCVDLAYFFPYLKQEVCIQINDMLGVSGDPSTQPNEDSGPNTFQESQRFVGTYFLPHSDIDGNGGNGVTFAQPTHSACTEASDPASRPWPGVGTYHYFHILIPR
ncbi:MAG: hypothetical protein RKE49_00815 [Oceanicaulis sp.]